MSQTTLLFQDMLRSWKYLKLVFYSLCGMREQEKATLTTCLEPFILYANVLQFIATPDGKLNSLRLSGYSHVSDLQRLQELPRRRLADLPQADWTCEFSLEDADQAQTVLAALQVACAATREKPESEDLSQEGILRRFLLFYANGKPVDPKAEYFVLRLDDLGTDLQYVQACREAVRLLAGKLKDRFPVLAKELTEKYGQDVWPIPAEQLQLGVDCPELTEADMVSEAEELTREEQALVDEVLSQPGQIAVPQPRLDFSDASEETIPQP